MYSERHTVAYSPGEYGWVIVDDDFPGLLMSFMKDKRDAQSWRAVKVGEGKVGRRQGKRTEGPRAVTSWDEGGVGYCATGQGSEREGAVVQLR